MDASFILWIQSETETLTHFFCYPLVTLVSTLCSEPHGLILENCRVESLRQVLEQHVPLTGFLPQIQRPNLLPSQINTIPYVSYMAQISAPSRSILGSRRLSTSCPDQHVCKEGPEAERKTFYQMGAPSWVWNVWKNMENEFDNCQPINFGENRQTSWHVWKNTAAQFKCIVLHINAEQR